MSSPTAGVHQTALVRNAEAVAEARRPELKTSASTFELDAIQSPVPAYDDDFPDTPAASGSGSGSSPVRRGSILKVDIDATYPEDGTHPLATGKPRRQSHGHRKLDSATGLLASPSLEPPSRRLRAVPVWLRPAAEWCSERPNQGFLLIAMSQLGFAFMNAGVALLANALPEGETPVPTWQIIWIRMAITGLGCVTYLYWAGDPNPVWGPKEVRHLLTLRGCSGFFGLFGIYFSLRYLSLSDATVLTFLAPVLSGLLAAPILGEPYSRLEGIAGFASLFGVVLIAKPEAIFGRNRRLPQAPVLDPDSLATNATLPDIAVRALAEIVQDDPLAHVTPQERLMAVGVSLVGVLGACVAYLTIRHIGTRANALHSIAYFGFWCTCVSTVYAIVFRSPPVMPNPHFFVMLLGIGVVGFLAQALLTLGLQMEKVARGTVAIYSNAIFAVILEKLCFGTTPDFWSVVGGGIIVGGALLVALRKSAGKEAVASSYEPVNTVDDEEALRHQTDPEVGSGKAA